MTTNDKDFKEDFYVAENGEYAQIQFVNLTCSDGTTFQLAVYNAHNGYYGHKIMIFNDDTKIHENEL